jgi:ketol-acid reductoisomerase
MGRKGMQVFRDGEADVNPSLVCARSVAIIGYGNQGHAHALNLRDSGVGNITIGARPDSPKIGRAEADGFPVLDPGAAAATADLVMILTPDETHGKLYEEELASNLKPGAAIGFAHGLAVHFSIIVPRPDLDVIMVAPKGPGATLRDLYQKRMGMLALFGIAQDASGSARALALSYGAALGCGRAGLIESSFGEECETDLFSEQVVLCGGLPGLIKAAFEILVEAGYSPQVAYIECLHEVKQIADLLWEGGLKHMDESISNTAEFGGYRAADRIVNDQVRDQMKIILEDVRSGRFVDSLLADREAGGKELRRRRQADAAHPLEAPGREVRALMEWLGKDKS